MKMIDFMTDENKAKVLTLNTIANKSHVTLYPKNHPLISEGWLKVVPPANESQKRFMTENHVLVQLSKKGQQLVLKALG